MKRILLSLSFACLGLAGGYATVGSESYYGVFADASNNPSTFVVTSDMAAGDLADILTANRDESADPDAWDLFQNAQNIKFKTGTVLNNADLAALAMSTNVVRLDMDEATIADGASIASLSSVAQYITLPDQYTEIDANTLPLCTSSKAVVSYKEGAVSGYLRSAENKGALLKAMQMLFGKVYDNEYYYQAAGVTKIKLTGEVNATDVTQSAKTNAFSENVITDEMIEEIAGSPYASANKWCAFTNANNVAEIDLSGAYFPVQSDMSILSNHGVSLTSIKLPLDARQTTLAAGTLRGCLNLTSLCIPINYQEIQAYCVPQSCNHITTTNARSYDEEYIIDNGPLSITLSTGLKVIRKYAFCDITGVKDVYSLKIEAPICELDAFSNVSYNGNNTIQAPSTATAISRDSYRCLEGQWIAVLHYPAEANTYALASKYTDVTRDFSIATGERDGRGNLIMFPNISEMNRAFVQACTGYTWNSTNNVRIEPYDANRPYWLEPLDNGSDEGVDANKVAEDYTLIPTGQPTATYEEEKYGGWHQFMLGSYSPIVEEEDIPEIEYYVYNTGNVYDNEWWTICLPIPLTKAMMLDVFGDEDNNAYPKLCRFVGVDRVVDEKIVLRFGEDLVAAASGDDAIVLEAGRPYMIKPHLPANYDGNTRIVRVPIDNTNQDIYKTLSNDEQMAMLKSKVEVVPQDNIRIYATTADYEQGVTTDVSNDTGVNAPYTNYTFVGSFWKYCLPQYSYFLGWDSSASKVKYFWKYSPVDEANRSWNTCTAVICPNWNTDADFVIPTGFETVHWDLTDFSQSDAFAGWSEAQSVEFAFECETDGISNVHMGDGSTVSFVKGTVYNLNGQAVKSSQLTKGLYIVNGKKFIVK